MLSGIVKSLPALMLATLTILCAGGLAQPGAQSLRSIDFEMMTWREVKKAMEQGKTTALIYNGGTGQRGPQNVNGGHTLMGHIKVLAIAARLGNAIATPVMPFSVNNASATLPGTIGLTGPLFVAVNEQVTEQLSKTGFQSVVLMGDHGGGQSELADPVRKPGEAPEPNANRVNNGITGDARPSTAELGKRIFQMKVDYAVQQIQRLLAK